MARNLSIACALSVLASCGKSGNPAGNTPPQATAEKPPDHASLVTGNAPESENQAMGTPLPEVEEKPLDHPAKVAEAARLLDLSTFPLMGGAGTPRLRTLANLAYGAPGDVKTAFEFQQKHLIAQRWKELPGSTVTAEYGSGTFTRAGFHVSVSVGPTSTGGSVDVTLHNHGNVDPARLPLPPATKPTYAGPITAMYTTEAPIAATAGACRTPLLAAGWQPYGAAGDTFYYKQNAIRITVMVASAPAQAGQTMINYMSELMSADLPAPEDAEDLQYTDTQPQLRFQTAAGVDAVAAFYRLALAPEGWAATKDKTVKVGDKDLLIFRNPGKAMVTLELKPDAGGKTSASLLYQTTAEIAELDRITASQKAAAIRMLKEKADEPEPRISLTLPAGAGSVEQNGNQIKFTVGKGKAKPAVEAWRKQYIDAGWKEDIASLDQTAGTVSVSKEGQSLNFTYTDTGFLPAEIVVHSTGAALERAGGG